MHIAWQEQFIDNILEIAEMNKINFLIATHSTDIIGENWGITHDLLGGSYS
jgi:predicted ATP-binding protein involved in virulence